jgi:large subunit ribosomal protein L11
VNIGEFVKQFNDATQKMKGDLVPVEISVYEDRTFSFVLKTPPASSLILKALGKEKGSGKNVVSKVGTLTKAQLREIAEKKMPDLNANDIEAAMKIIAGSARSMGVEVK